MWPGSAVIPAVGNTALFVASSSPQVTSAGGDSAQGLQVSSRALVQGGDRQQKTEVFCMPHSHRSYLNGLIPGHCRLPLPGEETKKQGSQGSSNHEGHPNLSPAWTLNPSFQFSLRERQWALVRRKSRGSSLQHLQASQRQRQDMLLN